MKSKFLVALSLTVFSSAIAMAQAGKSKVVREEGSLELQYDPKVCITTPCPQFLVLKVNGQAPEQMLTADLADIKKGESALFHFRNVTIKGSWTKVDDYLEVSVSEWQTVISEKVAPKNPPANP